MDAQIKKTTIFKVRQTLVKVLAWNLIRFVVLQDLTFLTLMFLNAT